MAWYSSSMPSSSSFLTHSQQKGLDISNTINKSIKLFKLKRLNAFPQAHNQQKIHHEFRSNFLSIENRNTCIQII